MFLSARQFVLPANMVALVHEDLFRVDSMVRWLSIASSLYNHGNMWKMVSSQSSAGFFFLLHLLYAARTDPNKRGLVLPEKNFTKARPHSLQWRLWKSLLWGPVFAARREEGEKSKAGAVAGTSPCCCCCCQNVSWTNMSMERYSIPMQVQARHVRHYAEH